MACPFFEPTTPIPSRECRVTGRWPLLAAWHGYCHAGGTKSEAPAELLQRCCNLGYARGDCPHFPASANADAVRFTVLPGDRIHYAIEGDYGPVEYGFADTAVDPIVRIQADAFRKGYEKRVPRPDSDSLPTALNPQKPIRLPRA